MDYVIMRKGLSAVLSNDNGWMVWDSFKMAHKSAQNFCGVVVPYEEAGQIITDNNKLEPTSTTESLLKIE